MALESLLAAAFAAGTLEGASILSSYSSNRSEENAEKYNSSSMKMSSSSNAALSLILPSLVYGTIALPMSIIGTSPGPGIINTLSDLHGMSHSDTPTNSVTSHIDHNLTRSVKNNKKTLVPGKLPRLKQPFNVISNNQQNALEPKGENEKKTPEPDGDVQPVNNIESATSTATKKISKLSELKLSASAVKRFRDDNKRAIQAMKETRTKQNPDAIKRSKSKLSKESTSNKNDLKQPSHNITEEDEILNSSILQSASISNKVSLASQFQNLFHLTAFPIYHPTVHSITNIDSTLFGLKYTNTSYYNTPPFAEMMRRIRLLLVGTAVVGSAVSYYSEKSHHSHFLMKTGTDTKTTINHISKAIQAQNFAIRYITEYDYRHNTYHDINHTKRGDIHTIPILLSTSTPSLDSFTQNKASQFTDVIRLNPTIPSQWYNLGVFSDLKSPSDAIANGSSYLICEADISIPINRFLCNKQVSNLIHYEPLSLHAVKLSTRILESMSATSSSQIESSELSRENGKDILNIVIQSGPSHFESQKDSKYVVIDSLPLLAKAIINQMELTYQTQQSTLYDEEESLQATNEKISVTNEQLDIQSPSQPHISRNTEPDGIPLFTTIGKTIRQGCMKIFSHSLFQSNKPNEQKVLYLVTNQEMKDWIEPYLISQGWKVIFYKMKEDFVPDMHDDDIIQQIPSNARIFICGRNDVSTIDQTCDFVSRIHNRLKDSNSTEPSSTFTSQPHIMTLLENETSKEMLQTLLQPPKPICSDYSCQVDLHSICIKSLHNEIFDKVRSLLMIGKDLREVPENINDALLR